MENKYAVHDEDDYCEDKFGVMLSRFALSSVAEPPIWA
jgi:hypothetical protein